MSGSISSSPSSLNLINGYTGQFSLGHAGFMAVGGYIAGEAHAALCAPRLTARAAQPLPLSRRAARSAGSLAALVGLSSACRRCG